MISALSGNSALALLSMFGRSQPASGASQEAQAARKPPPPPPPPSQGNGVSARSIFDALVSGSSTTSDGATVDDVLGQLVADLDADGDGSLSEEELTQAYQNETIPDAGLSKMVGNILARLNADGNGGVSAAELKSGLTDLAAARPQGPPPGGAAGQTADEAATKVVSLLDADGDRKLSAEELATLFESQDQGAPTSSGQKTLQELLFGLLLDQKDEDRTAQAATLYAA